MNIFLLPLVIGCVGVDVLNTTNRHNFGPRAYERDQSAYFLLSTRWHNTAVVAVDAVAASVIVIAAVVVVVVGAVIVFAAGAALTFLPILSFFVAAGTVADFEVRFSIFATLLLTFLFFLQVQLLVQLQILRLVFPFLPVYI